MNSCLLLKIYLDKVAVIVNFNFIVNLHSSICLKDLVHRIRPWPGYIWEYQLQGFVSSVLHRIVYKVIILTTRLKEIFFLEFFNKKWSQLTISLFWGTTPKSRSCRLLATVQSFIPCPREGLPCVSLLLWTALVPVPLFLRPGTPRQGKCAVYWAMARSLTLQLPRRYPTSVYVPLLFRTCLSLLGYSFSILILISYVPVPSNIVVVK